jgi:DNA polymerase elongation subunit (family B)
MKPIRTMDFETDPFAFQKRVFPFACGLYDGADFISVWSDKCAAKIVKILDKLEPSIIYMHNGGRFDIFYLLKYLDAEMKIINGRVVQCYLGPHEIRDSYAILPMALSQYKKDDIDIQKLSRERREENRAEILSYLRGDCVYLHELVSAFLAEFGDYLTIGSAAMGQLRKFHPFENGNKYLDDKFRKQFFFGGRVQCFQSGVISGPFKIYDVNSMYPYVMKNYRHPIGNSFEVDKRIRKNTAFVVAEGKQRGPCGAFPMRNKRGGIDFNLPEGTFACSIHEWETAEILEWFKPTRIIKTYGFDTFMSFGEFVDHFYGLRMKAKADEDKIHLIFYKLILNSAYGKFAQNPDNFCDFAITHGQRMTEPWREHFVHNEGEYVIWKKAVQRHSYYNVAVGASITGAARSVLLDGLYGSRNLIYCDTDSVICRELEGVAFSDTALGAWKLEARGNRIAIAGKKLYACFDGNTCVKKATKGARISEQEIVEVATGGTALYQKIAPTFKLDGRVQFIERRIKRTV